MFYGRPRRRATCFHSHFLLKRHQALFQVALHRPPQGRLLLGLVLPAMLQAHVRLLPLRLQAPDRLPRFEGRQETKALSTSLVRFFSSKSIASTFTVSCLRASDSSLVARSSLDLDMSLISWRSFWNSSLAPPPEALEWCGEEFSRLLGPNRLQKLLEIT